MAEAKEAMIEAQIMDERILWAHWEWLDAATVGDTNILDQSLDHNFQSATQPHKWTLNDNDDGTGARNETTTTDDTGNENGADISTDARNETTKDARN